MLKVIILKCQMNLLQLIIENFMPMERPIKVKFIIIFSQAAPKLGGESEVTEKYRALLCVSQAFFCCL
jgi:hypothetical protein